MPETCGALPTKPTLCYPCALRMSILHQHPAPPPPPPPPLQMFSCGSGTPSGTALPLLDGAYHPHFAIAYESAHSATRFFAAPPVPGDRPVADLLGSRPLPLLCVACLGLYQFLDYVHAPAVAAAIRVSPFTDSACLSVNVNVHRSMSFLWLAMAAVFFGATGRSAERPRAGAVVPEEHSNFKDFFMSDLRARVLQYVTSPHADVRGAPGHATYCAEITRHLGGGGGGSLPPSAQAFRYSPDNEGVVVDVSAEQADVQALANGREVPSQYCTNRCDGPLTYGVIYTHVLPFLRRAGWWTSGPNDNDNDNNNNNNESYNMSEGCEGVPVSDGPLQTAALRCSVEHANIFLIGTYRKLRRGLSQSPWFTTGGRVGTFSLQELIADPILPFFFPNGVCARAGSPGAKRRRDRDGDSDAPHAIAAQQVTGHGHYKFHSAGREDVDVRMLGSGRPFVLELASPIRECVTPADLAALTRAVNAGALGCVEVDALRLTDAGITVRLARHSESKVKTYRCVVWCSRAITDPENDVHFSAANRTRELVVTQRTPVRVLHRRSLQARARTIHSIRLVPLNAHWFLLDLETQAGTYVKEFVHGDMGRTRPHLGELLNGRTDILQLDVLGMAMEGL